jgi:hypothetical protein
MIGLSFGEMSSFFLQPSNLISQRCNINIYAIENLSHPDWTRHAIGEQLNLSPVFIASTTDSELEVEYKNRCMTFVVQRYYRKAAALIDFAARGDFPRIK